jgi:hypothetical protein
MRSILNAALESPHFALAKRLVLLVECHHAKDSIRPYLSNGWQGKLSAKYAQAERACAPSSASYIPYTTLRIPFQMTKEFPVAQIRTMAV